MQSNAKVESKGTLQMGGGQAQEGVLRSGSQDLKLLLGSVDMEVPSPGKLGYVSLTSAQYV
jgi:hypothetical protein